MSQAASSNTSIIPHLLIMMFSAQLFPLSPKEKVNGEVSGSNRQEKLGARLRKYNRLFLDSVMVLETSIYYPGPLLSSYRPFAVVLTWFVLIAKDGPCTHDQNFLQATLPKSHALDWRHLQREEPPPLCMHPQPQAHSRCPRQRRLAAAPKNLHILVA